MIKDHLYFLSEQNNLICLFVFPYWLSDFTAEDTFCLRPPPVNTKYFFR